MIISKLDSYRVFKNEEKNLAMQHWKFIFKYWGQFN